MNVLLKACLLTLAVMVCVTRCVSTTPHSTVTFTKHIPTAPTYIILAPDLSEYVADVKTTITRGKDNMIDKSQLRNLISTVLADSGMYSDSAVELLMMTAAVESKLGTYIRQIRGPARGVFQMEPFTHDDIWKTHGKKLTLLLGEQDSDRLEYDLRYSIIMSRMHYMRISSALPPASEILEMAKYWKKYYNTYLGKGVVAHAVDKYERYAV